MSLVTPLVRRRGSVTGAHEPALKSSETSSTKARLVAGHVNSSPLVALQVIDSGGGSTWNETVLVALPCGVRIVIGPEVASGGTTAVMRRSRLLVGALVYGALAPL